MRLVRVDGKASTTGIQQALGMFNLTRESDFLAIDDGVSFDSRDDN